MTRGRCLLTRILQVFAAAGVVVVVGDWSDLVNSVWIENRHTYYIIKYLGLYKISNVGLLFTHINLIALLSSKSRAVLDLSIAVIK